MKNQDWDKMNRDIKKSLDKIDWKKIENDVKKAIEEQKKNGNFNYNFNQDFHFDTSIHRRSAPQENEALRTRERSMARVRDAQARNNEERTRVQQETLARNRAIQHENEERTKTHTGRECCPYPRYPATN